MDVLEAIRTRRSIRKFQDKEVSRELVDRFLDAGRSAPSAGNLQARDFFVISDAGTKDELVTAAHDQTFIAQAPVVIVVCSNLERVASYGERGIDLYCIQDAGASVQNILLAVHSSGLASCWIGAFDEQIVVSALGLPEHLRPVALLPIGYPAEKGKERKKRDDDVHWFDR